MYNGLHIGKTGMRSSQYVMDNVADQLANNASVGYKGRVVRFNELLLNEVNDRHVVLSENAQDTAINAGSKATVSKTNFTQGVITPSEGAMHLAIEGRGFFGVTGPEGELMLSRNGEFHINEDKSISDRNGNPIAMDLNVPYQEWPDGDAISVNSQGQVFGTQEDGNSVQLGTIQLYVPENTENLMSLGELYYAQQAGLPLYNAQDNPELFGQVLQGYTEESNVDSAQAMVDMIVTQRAYQANARSVSTADEMLHTINTIL